jgi:predicted phosphodiesterase
MRLALISDIHANREAFEAVLERIDALGVDRVLCLGDIVGYYADAEACIELLGERGIESLGGNHDLATAGLRSAEEFGARARRVVEWTERRLSRPALGFLRGLTVARAMDPTFFAVHAALHPEPNDQLHLSSRPRVEASMRALASGRFGSTLCFFGHTHRPVIHALEHGRLESLAVDTDACVRLSVDACYLINPGSVGQPRDGDARASFAIWDGAKRTVAFHRVAYDWRRCHDKARRAGLLEPEPTPVGRAFQRVRRALISAP